MANYDHLAPGDCPVVKVEWADITQFGQWNGEEEVQTTDVANVGWLLEDDARWVVVASAYNYSDEQWADIHIFPKRPPEVTVLCPASSST